MGRGFWLNPSNGRYVEVTRHELTISDAEKMQTLGVAECVLERALGISPFSRQGEDELRMLGVDAGLVRIRDQNTYLAVQFRAPEAAEPAILAQVADVFEQTSLWRPAVKVQDGAEHLGRAHAVLAVVAEARDDARLVVVVPVQAVPADVRQPHLPAGGAVRPGHPRGP